MGSEGQSAVKDFHFEEKKREREKKERREVSVAVFRGNKIKSFLNLEIKTVVWTACREPDAGGRRPPARKDIRRVGRRPEVTSGWVGGGECYAEEALKEGKCSKKNQTLKVEEEEEEENETSRRTATTKSNAQLLSTTQVTTRSEQVGREGGEGGVKSTVLRNLRPDGAGGGGGGRGLEPSIRTSDVLTQNAAKSEGIKKQNKNKNVTFDLHQPGREVSEMCEFLKSTF